MLFRSPLRCPSSRPSGNRRDPPRTTASRSRWKGRCIRFRSRHPRCYRFRCCWSTRRTRDQRPPGPRPTTRMLASCPIEPAPRESSHRPGPNSASNVPADQLRSWRAGSRRRQCVREGPGVGASGESVGANYTLIACFFVRGNQPSGARSSPSSPPPLSSPRRHRLRDDPPRGRRWLARTLEPDAAHHEVAVLDAKGRPRRLRIACGLHSADASAIAVHGPPQ